MALLEVRELTKRFALSRRKSWLEREAVTAVNRLSFDLEEGRTLGVVGESGCGKTTLGKLLLRLVEPDSGGVRFLGADWLALRGGDLRSRRRDMQMVFQDPQASLNPRMRVGEAITEPLVIHEGLGAAGRARAAGALMERVGLPGSALRRYPHEFSGGQRQRLGIARAVSTRPRLLVADEPVSSLDVSIQAQILNLLKDLQRQDGMGMIFIAHDLRVVEFMSDQVAVMYLGRFVEQAPSRALYTSPRHPYTRALLSAIPPAPGEEPREAEGPEGEPPSPSAPPAGCPFHPRCPLKEPRCESQAPEWREVEPEHRVACHLA